MFKKRIHTSERAKTILLDLKKKTGILPNALCRIAIINSLAEDTDHGLIKESKVTGKGLEFLPETLFGVQNVLIHALVKASNLTVLEHIERGVLIINRQYHLAGNREKYFELI